MAKKGDIVRFLNSTGGGVITRIEGNIAYVDDDGFETPVMLRECVVVAQAQETKAKVDTTMAPAVSAAAAPQPRAAAEPELASVEETPEGEKLNVVLGYEPEDIKRLNTTTFNAYLVNDSNYYLYFTYLTRADGSAGWVTRYAGVVEPNIQIWIDEFEPAALAEMDRICVQLVAFKQGKEFALKSPVAMESSLDTTKFFKLHCFHDSMYFDGKVIAVDIVRNDVVPHRLMPDAKVMEAGVKEKKAIDRRKPVKVHRHEKKHNDVIEVDLHITELVDTTAGMSPADMLNLQIDEFRRVMDANLKNKGQKIVFIHGKGEGVLRQALMKELTHRYKGHDVQDASFREYGFGATQVTI